MIARLNVSVASALVRWQTALGELGRGLDHEHPRALGAVDLSDRDAEGLEPGQRVMAGTRFGGQASMVTVPEDQIIPLPDSFSYEQGAAFPVNYSTAYVALVIMGGLLHENPFFVPPDQFLLEIRERRSGRKSVSMAS